MTMNAAWHEQHRLPRGATMRDRVAWHVAHRKACGCRPMPAAIASESEAAPAKARPAAARATHAKARPAKPKSAATAVGKARRAAPAAAIDPRFAPIVSALAKERGVTYGGKGFGSSALKVDDKIFAMMSSKGEFVAKLSKARVEELVRKKQGKYFDAGRGRLMREWLSVTGSPASWLGLAKEALVLVRES
jgi:hypothetical protein